ncbi:MAG TPA: STAS domain-containing protein [Gammaproteobacteria bacterium]|nr:STAS domain-containing protein [Gammaproteobacteria bacterium]
MTTAAEVKISKDGKCILVGGVLSFATVGVLRDQGNQLQEKLQTPVFDFKEVIRADSSALALLTAWARYARGSGKTADFINIPPHLMDIACLSRLDKVLSLRPSKE